MKALEYRAEDAENRNRRNNLRIVGLPEGAEGGDPTSFIEGLLRDLLPEARWSSYFTVERAHRIPPKPGPPGSPPRTFILCLLNFRDRDEVLRASRNVGELKFQNTKLMIFPDYSVETQKLRKSFDQVKSALRSRSIRYSVLFPARLKSPGRRDNPLLYQPERGFCLAGLTTTDSLMIHLVYAVWPPFVVYSP